MNVERDVLERLDGLGYRWYVTRSWALAAYAEPRTTVDIDVVLEANQVDYSTRIRAALSDDFREPHPGQARVVRGHVGDSNSATSLP